MKDQDELDFGRFLNELNRETDRGLPLVAAALVDEKLFGVLRAFLCAGKSAEKLLSEPNAPLGTFSSRIEACSALGLIEEFEYQEITLIRKVRNLFAHSKHGLTFEDERVRGLCASLKTPLPSGPEYASAPPRVRFVNATVCLVLRLYYRDKWVAREARKPKEWVKPDSIGWRSVADEKPPPGVAVVAIGRTGPILAKYVDKGQEPES